MKETKSFDKWIGILSISVICIVAIVFIMVIANTRLTKETYALFDTACPGESTCRCGISFPSGWINDGFSCSGYEVTSEGCTGGAADGDAACTSTYYKCCCVYTDKDTCQWITYQKCDKVTKSGVTCYKPTGVYFCDDGEYQTYQFDCVPCAKGSACKKGKATKCDGSNEYQDEEGQSSCKTCPSGTIPNDNHTACKSKNECGDGEYLEGNSCKPCPGAYISDGATAKSQNDCFVHCSKGQGVAIAGGNCTTCKSGTSDGGNVYYGNTLECTPISSNTCSSKGEYDDYLTCANENVSQCQGKKPVCTQNGECFKFVYCQSNSDGNSSSSSSSAKASSSSVKASSSSARASSSSTKVNSSADTFTREINGERCFHDKSTGVAKIVYVKACQSYEIYGDATLCTTKDDGYVLISKLRDASNSACVTASSKETTNTSSTNTSSNPQTGTAGIILAWVIGLFAIGYSFWYFKRVSTN